MRAARDAGRERGLGPVGEGEGRDVHDGARLGEGPSGGGERGAGRRNVVHEEDAPAGHLDAGGEREDALDVLLPEGAREGRLPLCVARADEHVGFGGPAHRLSDAHGEPLGLVVAPFQEPEAGEGDGHHEIWARAARLGVGLPEHPAEGRPEAGAAAVLQGVLEAPDGPAGVERPQREGPLDGRVGGEHCGARLGGAGEAAEAARAHREVRRSQGALAAEAEDGVHQPGEPVPERAEGGPEAEK